MNEIVAIDIGTSRVGVALGNLNVKIAKPFAVWKYREAEKKLIDIIKNRSISVLVVGLPLNADDSESLMSKKARAFAKRINKRVKIKTVFVDEFATTLESKERFSKNADDSHSALIILERFFENQDSLL